MVRASELDPPAHDSWGDEMRDYKQRHINVPWRKDQQEKVVHITTKRDREECVICWQGHTLASQ